MLPPTMPLHRAPFSAPVHFQSAALASSLVGSKFFGHWLTDDCTQYLLAEQFSRPLVLRTAGYKDLANYEAYLEQNWTPTDAASVDELVIFQDFSQNSLKAKRYETLHRRLKKHFPESKGSNLVYLKRGLTGAPRLVDNESNVLDALTNRGFIVADIASDSIAQLLSKILNAKIVVSIEGSHIGHCCVALPTGGGLIALQVENKFSGVHRGWAEARSIRYGFVVGTKSNNGFHFPVSEILRTVDLMLNAL